MSVPKYNIIELTEANKNNVAQLFYVMWELLAPFDESFLLPEEVVVLKSWEFDSTHGNGIRDQVVNENYATIVCGLKALKELHHKRIDEYVAIIESTFSEFNVGCDSEEDFEKIDLLSLDETKRLYYLLDKVEEPFNKEIWLEGIIVDATYDYMKKNWDAFLSRM